MSVTIDDIRAALTEDVREQILDKPNVWAVGAGLQYIDGVEQKEPALTVRVEDKVAESELNLGDRIPPSISGVPVDVIEADKPTPDFGDNFGHGVQETDVRPVAGGVSLVEDGGTVVTAGGVFNDDTGNRVILTNEHFGISEGQTAYQWNTAIGTVQEQYAGYDTMLIDVTTESDASSVMLGAADIGEIEDPVVGERYLVCGHRTAWHGERCTGSDLYFTDMDGRGVEYRRVDYTNGSGNSGSCYGRYDVSTGTFHPVSLHYAGSEDYSYSMMMSSVQEAAGTLTPASQTTEPPGDGTETNAYFDAAVHDISYNSTNREFDISFIYGNLGGENTVNDTVTLEQSDGTAIRNSNFTANSLDFYDATWSVSDTRAGETLYITTRDNPENSVPLQSDVARYEISINIEDTIFTRYEAETLEYTINNSGGEDSDNVPVDLEIDGNVVQSYQIALESGESTKRAFIIDSGEWAIGTHTATVVTPENSSSINFDIYSEYNSENVNGGGGMGTTGMGMVGYGYGELNTTVLSITGTNSPVNEGNALDVDVDVENTTDSEVTDDIELRILE